MDVCTFYVGQGELVGIRAGNEGIIVDAHMPDNDHVQADEIRCRHLLADPSLRRAALPLGEVEATADVFRG